MRKIKYNAYVPASNDADGKLIHGHMQTEYPNDAVFHRFFTDPDSESCALIELPSGEMKTVGSHVIKFVEPATETQIGLNEIHRQLDYMASQLQIMVEKLMSINEGVWRK